MSIKKTSLLLIVLLVAACAPEAQSSYKTAKLTVTSAQTQQVHNFRVQIAETIEEQRLGLMGRKSLPKDAGMLFVYDRPQQVSYWMKNTYISLDMLFINEAGHIVNIAHQATPHSTQLVPSRLPVQYVLELNGGIARQLEIEVGDHVDWQINKIDK